MNQLLKIGQTVTGETSRQPYSIQAFLGGGGQGEVFRATAPGGSPVAVKWYFGSSATPEQRTGLSKLVDAGTPSNRFLWPIELISAPDTTGFGYVMDLRAPNYKGIVDLMKGRADPGFRALATAGYQLADSYFQLHAKGLCYRDISFGNVFFDPETGDVLICDNDNVAVDGAGRGGVLGTPRFMAPEVVRGEAKPSTQTDLFSLAVLLFYMFMIHHPLEGRRESSIKCLDLPAMNKLYGHDPLFIFDPNDDSNHPDPVFHGNALTYWNIYPQSFKEMFVRSFTEGISDPSNGRVRETEWRLALIRLRDSIVYCQSCGAENFYNPKLLQSGAAPICWNDSCGTSVAYPPRIRLGRQVVMLNHDTKLYPHHLDESASNSFDKPLAEVTRHPSDPRVWGLKNLSSRSWVGTNTDGTTREIEPGRSFTINPGSKLQFGNLEGEFRF